MKRTEWERSYLADMYMEFGYIFGTNTSYSYEPGMEPGPSVVPYSRLTEMQKYEIVGLRLRRVSCSKICFRYGIQYATLWRIQREYGITGLWSGTRD